jgi:hypothetical protein
MDDLDLPEFIDVSTMNLNNLMYSTKPQKRDTTQSFVKKYYKKYMNDILQIDTQKRKMQQENDTLKKEKTIQIDTQKTIQIDTQKTIPKNTIYKEYTNELNTLLIKSNIMNQITLIHEVSESDDKTHLHQLYNMLKNTLIIHGKTLYKMTNFTNEIDNYLSLIELNYNRCIIHKMISNIKNNNYMENIYFREITYAVSNVPPMSVTERMSIEENLPQFRYSRQIKKKQAPFNVDDIVGAKDKENKWWLARILHRFDAPETEDYWYYIRFENHGPLHDEWICSKTYRVRYFNPKKHFLKSKRVITTC